MSSPYVWHLSDEVLVHIFSFLPAEDVGRAASVCSRWARVAEDRRVWRGKSYLAEGGRGLSDAFPIARALPVLKRVSVHRGEDRLVYLSAEVADFRVPDLTDEATTSVISSLVTENLWVDFCLLEETSNCLLVQLHCLKQLQVCAVPTLLPRESAVAKLRALTGTLSREPLLDLRSVVVDTGRFSVEVDEDVESDIFAALVTCPALDSLSLRAHCCLSWQVVGEFSKLQFLQLQQCIIEDISFLDTFPNLRSLALDSCSPLGSGELSRKSELRGLHLRRLSVDSELLDALCRFCPELESIIIEDCPNVAHTLFLKHCPQLRFAEVNADGQVFPRVSGLSPELRHLRLNSPTVTSDSLAEMVKQLPRLQILDVVNCDIRSLGFLRHCADLSILSLGLEHRNTLEHFNELGGLRRLRKLYMYYGDTSIGPLAEVLHKMPQLESLDVGFLKSISDLSFLRHCRHLHSLTLRVYFPLNAKLEWFHELANLKELRKLVVDYLWLGADVLGATLPRMPNLEELHIEFIGKECDFSFLRHCCLLTSLQVSGINVRLWHFAQLRRLCQLRRLTVVGVPDGQLPSLVEEVRRMPQLEYLGLRRFSSNFLESWEWRRMLSSQCLKG